MQARALIFLILPFFSLFFSPIATAASSPALSMYGDLKYGAGFDHFAYVNPNAPKGGALHLFSLGTFDSLNPFILKGQPAAGLNAMGQGLLYESLMTQSEDEPFSMYGLIADGVDISKDRRTVTFTINKKARWHDGKPITAHDVKWTFEQLMEKGSPFYKAYFADVDGAAVINDHTITFKIKNPKNRELPLILSQLVVAPQHDFEKDGHDFGSANLTPPLGSGPYKIKSITPGAEIIYERVKDWWGADLPVNRGRYNFDTISYDYYRDDNVAIEAFFAGNYDVRQESVARLWTTAYTAAPVKDGRITKAEIPHRQPVGMQGFAFNTRRPVFSDVRVRAALELAFDYEWANKQLAAGSYTRSASFFENSDLAARGTPAEDERALLQKLKTAYPGDVPDAALTDPYMPPTTDGSGNNRENLKRAAQILDEAGYKLGPDGVRMNENGVRLTFEYIDTNPAFERWLSPFLRNLKKIGVAGTLRVIDPAQYQNRMNDFDYDMTTIVIPQSDSPGNEQVDEWTSAKADIKGSRNYMGVKNRAVNDLVDQIVSAQTRAQLITSVHALDRILLHSHYVIPGWHYAKWRIAWWAGLSHPSIQHTKSLGIADTWWHAPSPQKAKGH